MASGTGSGHVVRCRCFFVAKLSGREVTDFLLNSTDGRYRQWWLGRSNLNRMRMVADFPAPFGQGSLDLSWGYGEVQTVKRADWAEVLHKPLLIRGATGVGG